MAWRNDYTDKVICPRCNIYTLPIGYPGALSRADNNTEICSKCGNDEGMLDYFEGGCQPVEQWPVTIKYLFEEMTNA